MRLSCRDDDAGYTEWRRLLGDHTFKFYLNGAEVDSVVTADEEEGFLICYAKDENGDLRLTEDRQDAVTERLTGAVRIEVTPCRP